MCAGNTYYAPHFDSDGRLENPFSAVQPVVCPVLTASNDFTGQESTAEVQVWGVQSESHGLTVAACDLSYDSGSLTCGSPASVSGTGYVSIVEETDRPMCLARQMPLTLCT